MWNISENTFIKDNIPHFGNKYLIGNGYMGIRGTMEEFDKANMCAINLAGIYDRVGDSWREPVNAPNVLYTYIEVNGKKYALPNDEPFSHKQKLDFYNAIHKRETTWQTSDGKFTVKCERFASMSRQHIIAMKYSFTADFDCAVKIVTGIDGDVWDINGPHFQKFKILKNSVTGITVEKKTEVYTKYYLNTDFECEKNYESKDKSALTHISFTAKSNIEYTVEKTASVSTSIDTLEFSDDIKNLSYQHLKDEHTTEWNKIWDISKFEIEGDKDAELSLNYSIYHLNCIAPRNLDNYSIAARGLSGQVYKGAIFWDTEMFMLDYFAYTDPKIAKTLLKYRIDTLKGARIKAEEYGLKGAFYAWESQEGGYEACSDYNVVDVFTSRPMRTHFRDKQYHVSSAIVLGFIKYIEATNDISILTDGGLEVIIECARMYRSLLLQRADSDTYEILGVVGPDEYHECVNNNIYTNKMAKFVFKTAINMIKTAREKYTALYTELDEKYNLEYLETIFDESEKNIFIHEPDKKTGVIEQFDGYLKLKDESIDEVRAKILHPKEYWGGAYGIASDTQIIKQADTVAMLSIFHNEYSNEILEKNWDYYEPRTEHGSSLSACMYSLLSCYTKKPDKAYPLFIKSASADLTPGGKEWAGNIYIGGTHPASAGGAWIVTVKGFAGIDTKDGELVSTPNLPSHWKSLKFKLVFKDELYSIKIENNKATITKTN